jgi:hypothetical protein
MAGNAGAKPVRPYAFALLPAVDRLVVTSAPMMESSSADVVQIYRYSDFKLLKTIDLPAGKLADRADRRRVAARGVWSACARGRISILQYLWLYLLPAERDCRRQPAPRYLLCVGDFAATKAGLYARFVRYSPWSSGTTGSTP